MTIEERLRLLAETAEPTTAAELLACAEIAKTMLGELRDTLNYVEELFDEDEFSPSTTYGLERAIALAEGREPPEPPVDEDGEEEEEPGEAFDDITIGAHTEPLPGFAYPLCDPGRYDDEYGVGYDHATLPKGARASLPGGAVMSINDMWICRATGDVHPGLNACPIPVRIENIDLSAGKRIEKELPDPDRGPGWR